MGHFCNDEGFTVVYNCQFVLPTGIQPGYETLVYWFLKLECSAHFHTFSKDFVRDIYIMTKVSHM